MRALVLGGILGSALIAACFIERPSENLDCSVTADCESLGADRRCVDGFCVVPNCPADCSSCNETMRTCLVECSDADDCDTSISCPSGWTCTINCNGDSACNDIVCNSGARCTITCNGAGSCGDVNCDSACQCDVTCAAGACDSTSCPTRGNGANQVHCTEDGTVSTPCDSARAASCASC
jgi:hypothetical protein